MAVDGGEVVAEVAYPVCGLLSDLSAEELAAEKKTLIAKIHEMGSEHSDPVYVPFLYLPGGAADVCHYGPWIYRCTDPADH